MSEIRWESPPEIKNRKCTSIAFVDELKKRPGEWALYPTEFMTPKSASTNAWTLKRAYRVEAVSRGNRVYARWAGGGEK